MKTTAKFLTSAFKDRTVLVIGGLGFIGSNLALKLINLGANVTILTESKKGQNELFKSKSKEIKVVKGDIRNFDLIKSLVRGKNFVFNMSGHSGATDSLDYPFDHLSHNVLGQLTLLQSVAKVNPNSIIFFPSSQLVYGKPLSLPVKEDHRTEPNSLYGANKLLCEKYNKIYSSSLGIKTVTLRISNPYGPKQKPVFKYGLVGYFISLAMNDRTITIYGDGSQKRGYIFIDDLVEAILQSVLEKKAYGDVFNVSGKERKSVLEMAQIVVKSVGRGKISFVSWPGKAKKVETGDIYLDIGKIKRDLSWEPSYSLNEGIKQTLKFFDMISNH